MIIQGWFPLGLAGLISLLSKGLSRVFSSTTVLKYKKQIEMMGFKTLSDFTAPSTNPDCYYEIIVPSPCMHAKLIQSCLTLCDFMDCSPPGSSVHGILQTRILEWVTMPSSKGSSWPRDRNHIFYVSLRWQVGSWPLEPPGKPTEYI